MRNKQKKYLPNFITNVLSVSNKCIPRLVAGYGKIDCPDWIKFNNICDDFDLLTKGNNCILLGIYLKITL